MVFSEIITLTRQLAGDVDAAAQRYSDAELVPLVQAAQRIHAVRGVAGMGSLTIPSSVSDPITPVPSEYQGVLLAYWSAVAVLWETYAMRLDTGTLGTSWRSGLEAESSIQLQKAYVEAIESLESDAEEILLIGTRSTFATRVQ